MSIGGRNRAMKWLLVVLYFPVLCYIDHVAHNEQTWSLEGENKPWTGWKALSYFVTTKIIAKEMWGTTILWNKIKWNLGMNGI